MFVTLPKPISNKFVPRKSITKMRFGLPFVPTPSKPDIILSSISDFVSNVKAHNVADVIVQANKGIIYYNDYLQKTHVTEYTYSDELWSVLLNNNVDVMVDNSVQKTVPLGDVIGFLVSAVIMIYVIRMSMITSKLNNNNSATVKPVEEDSIKDITFDKVQGIDECKHELEEIVDYLKHPEPFQEAGAKVPSGALLVGAPGTGKTLLAKAIANEASVPFFQCSGSSFIEMFVGTGAKRVRELFESARKVQPCIVFIDEIDAIGRKRSSTMNSQASEYDQTINQLLVEMDGFDTKNSSVIVIGATNRIDILDEALIRPGRFDRKIEIRMPNREGREKILEVHSENKKLDVSLASIADQTIGFSGAELENLMNECAITATKESNGVITKSILEDAYQRIVIGNINTDSIQSKDTRERIAYHEAGHAVVGCLTPNYDLVRKVSIVSRGNAGGITFFQPRSDDITIPTLEYLESQIKVFLAGYAVEELVYGKKGTSCGASNDLLHVHAIAKDMITCYGFNDFVGKINISDHVLSPEMAFHVDSEIRRIVDCYYNDTCAIVEKNMKYIHLVKDMLLKDNIIEGLSVYDTLGVYPSCEII